MVTPPLLFDLDGTLADTLQDIAASANHVRQQSGLAPLPLAAVREMVGDGATALLQRALGELRHPADDAPFWRLALQRYAEHHEDQCTVTVRLYPGVAAGLERFAAADHAMAVVTNKPVRFAEAIVSHLGLDDLLPVVVGGDSLAVRKPDPAPLRLALSRLGDPPGRGRMIGDGLTDLRAGKAAGLYTIACLYGYRRAQDLRAEGADAFWEQFGQSEC